MSHGFAVLLTQKWDQAACGRLLDAVAAGGLTLAHPPDGDGRILQDGGDDLPIGLGELTNLLGSLESDISSQFWLTRDTDVGFWWQRHGAAGALLIFYLDGLLAEEAARTMAALCRGCVALDDATAVLACDMESHTQADDWLDEFESGWPAVMPMPCVLVLGEAVREAVRPRLRPAPDERELDCALLLGRPGDHKWAGVLALLGPDREGGRG